MTFKLKKIFKKFLFNRSLRRKGVTLVEMMIAMSLLSIGVLGMIGSFTYLNKGLQSTKGRTLANNLAQEKIELLKNKSYYRVLVTTETTFDENFDPFLEYDTYPNGVENISVGGINFTRFVYVRKITEDVNGDFTYLNWNQPDTGMKEIAIFVIWKEGDIWKKLELRNVKENLDRSNLNSTFSGTIDDGADPIEGVTVKALENPSRFGISDALGEYSFTIEAGSYTLRASTAGYFSSVTGVISIEESDSLTQNFTLTKMDTGTISGRVYMSDHMVIYMVVASTIMASGDDVEFVTLYNPTTHQINLLTNPADSTSNNIKLAYYGQLGEGKDIDEFWLNHTSTFVPAGHYYLIASAANFTFRGVSVTADAVYTAANSPPCASVGALLNCIRKNSAGAIRIKDVDDNVIDTLGWTNNGAGKPAPYYETTAKSTANGILEGGQFCRYTKPAYGNQFFGNCYDTDINSSNFFSFASSIFKVMNIASGYKAPVSGSPAEDAIVYADDGTSNSAIVDSAGDFSLINVATGAWTVYISSDMLFLSIGTFGGLNSGFTDSMTVRLDSTTTMGYITGTVTDINGNPIEAIVVYAGSVTDDTDADGKYILGVEPETMDVIANYNTQDSQYVQTSSINIVVTLGEMTRNVDITLLEGGKLSGWITTNDVDPLPNIPVAIFKNNVESGAGSSGSDGYFYISGISSGTYGVEPQLEAGESSVPSSHTVVMTASADIFIGTFTVSGAMGHIIGDVTFNGEIIDTGVLIYASTSTIAGDPPPLTDALRSGPVIYYAVSSNFDGTYTLPVRGGYTYNVYAWHTTWSGSTPTTNKDSYEGVNAITVAAGETETQDFSW